MAFPPPGHPLSSARRPFLLGHAAPLRRQVEEWKLRIRQQSPYRLEEAFGRDFLVGLDDVDDMQVDRRQPRRGKEKRRRGSAGD
jgi:hypothetical protein